MFKKLAIKLLKGHRKFILSKFKVGDLDNKKTAKLIKSELEWADRELTNLGK